MMMPRMQEVFPDHDMASLPSALITSEFNINHPSRLILGQAMCELAPQSTMGERLSIWRPKSINLVSFQANFLVRLTVNIQRFCLISDY